ncbi:peptidase [Paraburkholderia phytofirmans]|nr:peptidase [Paraburkholderia phytofirmans]
MALYHYLQTLQPKVAVIALLVSIPLVFVSYSIHEAAHWLAGRAFGATGSLTFFPLRGKSRLWMVSIMGMRFDDAARRQVSRSQIRMMALAGPAWDLMFGAACMCFYHDLTGPEVLRATVACVGVSVLFSSIALNVVPLPIGNDGWRVLHPD